MRKRLLCRAVEVPENGLKECEAEDGLKVVVANAGGEFFGFQAICPHQEVPLCEGLFDGSVLTCHMHLWQWDVRTGAPLGIAEAPLQRYPVTVEGDSLYLGGDDSALGTGELFNGLPSETIDALARLARRERSEEHTSELQSHSDLVCRLLLEKKKAKTQGSNLPAPR